MKRGRNRRRKNRIERSLVLAGVVKDSVAASAASEVDALGDYEWLIQHPEVQERRRPATQREIRAYGLPPGSQMIAALGPDNTLAQMALVPKK